MNLSYQLYSSRFVGDWEAVLAHLAKTGYAEVEGFMGAIDDPAEFRASLDRHGLSMPSIHLGIEDLEADIDGAISTAKTLGVGHVFAPYLDAGDRPTDAAGWQAFAARLAAVKSEDIFVTFSTYSSGLQQSTLLRPRSRRLASANAVSSRAPAPKWSSVLPPLA